MRQLGERQERKWDYAIDVQFDFLFWEIYIERRASDGP